ncbi:MAG: peptidylprolyl isomerase [Chloroflexi bacterium HGW-Chloroflexi-6]|nr:MAG: peptidylprolyl isomerase [Chloroflexi bacterium HGW-Chloroflexi-6]
MPSKKQISKRQAVKADVNAKNIQIAAVAVFVLILAIVAWVGFSQRNQTPAALENPQDQPTQQASAPQEQPKTTTSSKQYSAPPEMSIDLAKRYLATFKLAKGGEFVIELYPDKAPITVNSFVFLAREGYYNGTTFHRVLPDFMAQGGDPTGTGSGGPGYAFVNEDSDLTFDKAGVLAMANAGRDTNGSQFFITFSPQEYLNGGYTIFGQVIEGLDVVLGIRLRDPQQFPDYEGDVLESITITEE